MAKQEPATGNTGREEKVAKYEKELAGYLQERIKPGLNRGAIPLLARSIAKEIAHREHPNGAFDDAEAEGEPSADANGQPDAGAADQPTADADQPAADADDDQAEPEAEADDDEPRADEDDEPSADADDQPEADADDDEPSAEEDDEPSAEEDDEPSADADDESSAESGATPDFEADMHDFQAKLGEDWIVHFSVHGDDGWLTAEKEDGSQRLEAQTASVLAEAVELLNKGGGRSS
jgi:hypothetical protein